MTILPQTNLNCVGSHVGVSIGEDGPSQMGLEDLAMFRSIPTATVFYPSDAVSTERACELAANTPGICFIRTSRPGTAVVYDNDHKFEVSSGLDREAVRWPWTVTHNTVTLLNMQNVLRGSDEFSNPQKCECRSIRRGREVGITVCQVNL